MKPTLSTSDIPFHLQDKLDKIEFAPKKRRPWPVILLVIVLLHVGLFTLLQKDLLNMFHRALGKKVIYVSLVPATTPFSVPTPEPSVKPPPPSTKTSSPPTPTKPVISVAAPNSEAPAAPSAAPPNSTPAPSPAPAAAESKSAPVSTPPPTSSAPKLISSGVRYLQAPQPNYPAVSRNLGEQGRVMLRVLINEFGKPEQVEISQSSGFGRLDAAARLAVLKALFSPHLENGRAITVLAEVPIVFELEA